jgi:hypothetical protein
MSKSAEGNSLNDEDDDHNVEQDEVQLCSLVGHKGKAICQEWEAKDPDLQET